MIYSRCRTLLCNHRPCFEGTTNEGSEGPADCGTGLGLGYLGNVQLPYQRIQNEERKLSFLASSVLDSKVEPTARY